MHLDPTMDDVKKLAVSSRRAAKVPAQAHTYVPCIMRLSIHQDVYQYCDCFLHRICHTNVDISKINTSVKS